jgi:hypothetical protein
MREIEVEIANSEATMRSLTNQMAKAEYGNKSLSEIRAQLDAAKDVLAQLKSTFTNIASFCKTIASYISEQMEKSVHEFDQLQGQQVAKIRVLKILFLFLVPGYRKRSGRCHQKPRKLGRTRSKTFAIYSEYRRNVHHRHEPGKIRISLQGYHGR